MSLLAFKFFVILAFYKFFVGDVKIEKENEIVVWEEALSERTGSSVAINDQNEDMSEIFNDRRSSECSQQVILSYFIGHVIFSSFIFKFSHVKKNCVKMSISLKSTFLLGKSIYYSL